MSSVKKKRRPGRKLLVASLGVAAVSYVASCGGSSDSDGTQTTKDASTDKNTGSDVVANLIAPPDDASDQNTFNDVVANLIAPPDDASADAASDAVPDAIDLDVVANLIAPPDSQQ